MSEPEKIPESPEPGNTAPTEQTAQTESVAAEITPDASKPATQACDYYYTQKSDAELKKADFTRTLLTLIAFFMQLTVLLLPQAGLEYVTNNYPSYAYCYVWAVLVLLAVSVYVIIMNFRRYRLQKRIPAKHAPRTGFKRRTFLGTEIFMAINVLPVAFEISFVCFEFDAFGLISIFVTALAAAAAVWSRIVAVQALSDAQLISSSDVEA